MFLSHAESVFWYKNINFTLNALILQSKRIIVFPGISETRTVHETIKGDQFKLKQKIEQTKWANKRYECTAPQRYAVPPKVTKNILPLRYKDDSHSRSRILCVSCYHLTR